LKQAGVTRHRQTHRCTTHAPAGLDHNRCDNHTHALTKDTKNQKKEKFWNNTLHNTKIKNTMQFFRITQQKRQGTREKTRDEKKKRQRRWSMDARIQETKKTQQTEKNKKTKYKKNPQKQKKPDKI